MNDDRLGLDLAEWMKATEYAPPDARRSARQVATRLPQTRQLGRRRWLPSLNRKPGPSGVTDTTEYQLGPMPATDGHAPTVIGRTQSMLSPAKAITAGALVFAIGGVLLIAQPFSQKSGNPPGAAIDEVRAAPVEFTATWLFGGAERVMPTETDGDPYMSRVGAWDLIATNVTDPRFFGHVTVFDNLDEYSGGNIVFGDAFRVENADGAWQSEPGYSVDFADGSNSGLTAVFHGEDAYAGLVAVVDMELVRPEQEGTQYFVLNGVIFDGDLPPQPEARPLP